MRFTDEEKSLIIQNKEEYLTLFGLLKAQNKYDFEKEINK